jgi:starch synthase
MKVFHISAECYPVAKAGGLADVVGALPRYQRENGIEASVIMPWYDKPFVHNHSFLSVHSGDIRQGSQVYSFEILKEESNSLGFDLFLVRVPGLLDRPEVYGYPDESDQFMAFQHAFLQWIMEAEIKPTILHCHDHHAGLIPFFVEHCKEFSNLNGTPTVFTVHNGEYQGVMPWHKARLMPEFDNEAWGLLDWNHLINPLATAIKCSWAYTTVSEGYLLELYSQPILGPLFLAEKDKSYGIVNGIDVEVWDPDSDPLLDFNYNVSTVVNGKKNNKNTLCKDYKLDEKLPLVAFIGRFAGEKGADLLPGFIQHIIENNKQKVSIFILGSGDPLVEKALRSLNDELQQAFALVVGYDEALAHRIYASADFLVMPSRVEPCGLNQLYAMRFGTIPVVRAIGGLKDTVNDISTKSGNGFLFVNPSIEDFVKAVERALEFYKESSRMNKLRKSNMELDYSWKKSSEKYNRVYDLLIDKL